jgi:hypothetical protein
MNLPTQLKLNQLFFDLMTIKARVSLYATPPPRYLYEQIADLEEEIQNLTTDSFLTEDSQS